MTLYSLRTAPTGFTITKFDEDFNPVATYHLEPKGFSFTCDCPANSRPVVTKPCRHKLMMPNLLPYADTDKFFDYDTGEFTTPLGDPHRVPPEEGEAQPLVGEAVHAEASPSLASPKPYRQQVEELFAPPVVAPTQPLVIRRR